jgi:D-glycero-D-manno-heptose 1,7-bisphosphate phosphatase
MADPCAFLDRDGTLIADLNYLSDPTQAVLLPGVVEGLKALINQGFRLIVISNQSGIGRGYFTEADAHSVNGRVDDMLCQQGVEIAAWYICPHAPNQPCQCRKPLPGMIDRACEDFKIDLSNSIMIGDKDVDLQLATTRGLRGYLVTSGCTSAHVDWAKSNGYGVFADIAAVARHVAESIYPNESPFESARLSKSGKKKKKSGNRFSHPAQD